MVNIPITNRHKGSFLPSVRRRGSPKNTTSLAAVLHALFAASPAASQQSSVPLAVAHRLAIEHASTVDADTLLAFAQHESKLRPWAIHDNTTTNTYLPASAAEATALASTLLNQGHSLDLGIMRVNSTNLRRTGLTVEMAFDPGESMRAGAQILVAAYRQCLHGNLRANSVEQQVALRCAASVYNTSQELAGILNG